MLCAVHTGGGGGWSGLRRTEAVAAGGGGSLVAGAGRPTVASVAGPKPQHGWYRVDDGGAVAYRFSRRVSVSSSSMSVLHAVCV